MSSHAPTFFINLDHNAGCRGTLERQLDALGLLHQRFPGMYGKTFPVDELVHHYDHARAASRSRELIVNEVDCVLSHLGVYRAMIGQNLPYALILEDDAKLGLDVSVVPDALAQSVSPDEPVVTLPMHIDRCYKHSARLLTADHRTAKLANYQQLTRGYFVARATVKRMAEQLYPVWLIADYWYKFERGGIVQMRVVVPYVIGVQSFDDGSNLEANRVIKSREADDRLGPNHHLCQISVRKFLYQVLVRPSPGTVKQKKIW